MAKKVLKAKQIEKLENTSFASLLMPMALDAQICGITVCTCGGSCNATCCAYACTGACSEVTINCEVATGCGCTQNATCQDCASGAGTAACGIGYTLGVVVEF